jgi:hypothetical protein
MTKKTKHAGRPKSAGRQRSDQSQGAAERGSGSAQLPPTANLRRTPSVAELALEQGIRLAQDVDQVIGQGAECWDSDADFERWMQWLGEIRQEGR